MGAETSRLNRFRAQVRELEARRSVLARNGRFVESMRLNSEIERVKALIKEAEEYEARPINEVFEMSPEVKSHLTDLILECHLAADYLNDCAYALNDFIESLGYRASSIIPDMKDILQKSGAFAALLCKRSPELCEFISFNEKLLDQLHDKSQKYIIKNTRKKKRAPRKKKTENAD